MIPSSRLFHVLPYSKESNTDKKKNIILSHAKFVEYGDLSLGASQSSRLAASSYCYNTKVYVSS